MSYSNAFWAHSLAVLIVGNPLSIIDLRLQSQKSSIELSATPVSTELLFALVIHSLSASCGYAIEIGAITKLRASKMMKSLIFGFMVPIPSIVLKRS